MYRSLVTYYDVLENIIYLDYLNGDISGDVISCSKYNFDLFFNNIILLPFECPTHTTGKKYVFILNLRPLLLLNTMMRR